MASDDGKPEQLRIVLLGDSGSGKSLTGNTILGKRAFTARRSQDPETLTCQAERGEFEGTPVSVVDTPGTIRHNTTEMSKCISYSAPGPHAFLLVIPLKRVTDVERQVKSLQQTFGKDASRYTIILFTCADELAVGVTTQPFIRQNPLPHGVVHHVFNNRDEDPIQVRELLEKINSMVQRNGGSYCIKDRDWKHKYLYPIATAVTIGGGIGAASGGTGGGVYVAFLGSAVGAVAANLGDNRAAAGAVAVVGAFTVGTVAGIGASAGLVPVLGIDVFMVALFVVIFPVLSGISGVLFFAASEVGDVAQCCVVTGAFALFAALYNGGGDVTADTGPADVLRTVVVVYGGVAAKVAAAIFAGADTAGAAFEVFDVNKDHEVCFCAKGAIICGAAFGAAASAAVGVDTGEDFLFACFVASVVVIFFLLLLFVSVSKAPSAFNKTVGCTIAGVSVGAAFGAAVVVLGASGFVAGGVIIIACKAVAMWLNRQG